MSEQNGSTPAPTELVRFGRGPHQLMPKEVAEEILCEFSAKYAQLFGRLYVGAMVGSDAVPQTRARAPR